MGKTSRRSGLAVKSADAIRDASIAHAHAKARVRRDGNATIQEAAQLPP
jgi:hypothetical protein